MTSYSSTRYIDLQQELSRTGWHTFILAMGDSWKGVAIHKSNQIYVSNLPEGTTEQMVTELFGQVGQVAKDPKQTRFNPNAKKVYMYKDKRTGRMKGDGTVTFIDEDTAAAAVEFFHNAEFIPGDHVAPHIWCRWTKLVACSAPGSRVLRASLDAIRFAQSSPFVRGVVDKAGI
jgi:hypothetical protein